MTKIKKLKLKTESIKNWYYVPTRNRYSMKKITKLIAKFRNKIPE